MAIDPTSLDPKVLAEQLCKPSGEIGQAIGEVMAKRHVQAMAFTFEHLHVQPSDHVLEIGFGPGEAIAEAVRLTPKGFVAGIDYSDAMLHMAEKRNHRAIMEEHVELHLGDAQHLPFEDESFDKLFAMNVFHFWQEPQRELAECKRVLKRSGRILLYITHHSGWIKGLGDSALFMKYELADVERILNGAAFRDVASSTALLEDRKCFVVCGTK